jgi:hypothetical protein
MLAQSFTVLASVCFSAKWALKYLIHLVPGKAKRDIFLISYKGKVNSMPFVILICKKWYNFLFYSIQDVGVWSPG